jgi:S-adenosylmethionine:tRNA ribosyltransferase-isomerase
MIAAGAPIQRPTHAKLLVVDKNARITHASRTSFADFLRRFDLVVANDAATLPASLAGFHEPTGEALEVRLAGSRSLDGDDVGQFVAIVFGAGDFRIRTEDRPQPPPLRRGERLLLGPLRAKIERILDHPRLVVLRFEGSTASIWEGIARHGRPIQYAHIQTPLVLWDVWTCMAGAPFAFEPPSAGFMLDWKTLASIREGGADFATITHAAGISSTGDEELDQRLPFDEPYRIPAVTAAAIRRAKNKGGRIVAIGTTVVRALEHSALIDGTVRAGAGIATQRIGADTLLRIVDAIVSGTHEAGTSHYELLRAFADDATLRRAAGELDALDYRTHEFGDSILIERGYRTMTRANLRLPACTTTVRPGAIVSVLSTTTSPSILRPRCAMSRSASDVESTIPACLAS